MIRCIKTGFDDIINQLYLINESVFGILVFAISISTCFSNLLQQIKLEFIKLKNYLSNIYSI